MIERRAKEIKIYTPEEVAEILKVRPQTVLKWLRQGIMPGSKIQKKWRITEEDLKLFLEKNKNIGR